MCAHYVDFEMVSSIVKVVRQPVTVCRRAKARLSSSVYCGTGQSAKQSLVRRSSGGIGM